MTLRKIYLGDYNNRKKEELLTMSEDYLKSNKGANFLYILPNGNLLTSYRKYFIDRLNYLGELNIYTFDDIANRLAKSWKYRLISNRLKEIFIENILRELYEDSKLSYYGPMVDKKGFIKNISDIISQMKSSLIRAEEYLDRTPKEAEFLEIGYIYLEYERLLKENRLMDEDDKFLHTIDGLKENYRGFLRDVDFIIIDEFYDFRPQELAIIKEIARLDIDIHINMPFNRERNFKVMDDTIEKLLDYGFELKKIDKSDKNIFENLANCIFEGRELESEAISLVKAPTKYLEVKKIAENIKKEYVGGRELRDMAVVVTSDKYRTVIEDVFEYESIAMTEPIKDKLTNIALVRELFYLLDYSLEEDMESFVNRLKSNYFSLVDYEDRESIEYYLRNNCLDLKELREGEVPDHLEEKVLYVLRAMDEESGRLNKRGTIREFSEELLEIIEKNKTEENILSIYDRTGDYDILHRDLSALKLVKESLNKIIDLDKELFKEIELSDYIDILHDYLEGEAVVLAEGNPSGVRILSTNMLRGYRYGCIFIVGLTQGDYPNLRSDNFFFRDENYTVFEEIGLEYKNYHERLDKESMNFAIGLSQAIDRLYLSYSENTTDNDSGIASIFLDELLYSLRGDSLEDKLSYEELDMSYGLKKELENVTNLHDFSYYVLSQENMDLRACGKLNSLDKNRLKQIRLKSRGEYERYRGQSSYSGVLEDKGIIADINKKLDNKTYSISYLESYGKCPYYFMLGRLLGLDSFDRKKEEFSKIDRGRINHMVLQDFYSNHEDEIRGYILSHGDLDFDRIESYLLKRYKEHQEYLGLEATSPIYSLKRETNVEKIGKFIEFDLERLKGYRKKMIPVEYEKEFGSNRDFYIEDSGERLYFTGIIDRIDRFVGEEGYLLMDYKNSSYGVASKDDLDRGISLQLPVYLMSMRDKRVIGGVYGVISNGSLEILMIDEREKEIIGRKRSGIYSETEIGDIVDRSKDYIIQYISRIRTGDFRLEPKDCSPYCEYRNICRIRKDLEVDYD